MKNFELGLQYGFSHFVLGFAEKHGHQELYQKMEEKIKGLNDQNMTSHWKDRDFIAGTASGREQAAISLLHCISLGQSPSDILN